MVKKNNINQKKNDCISIIKQLMSECGIKEAELARQTGLPQTTVNRLLLGETADPRANTLIPIANYFGIGVGQLLGQEPLSPYRIKGTFQSTNKSSWSTIPVIEWNEAKSWLFKKNVYTPSSYQHWITSEKDISADSFALRTLPSMEPRFRKNSVIIIDPQKPISDGNFVIISIHNEEPTIRRIIQDGDTIYLKKLYGKEEITIKNNKDNIIGVIIETRINEQ